MAAGCAGSRAKKKAGVSAGLFKSVRRRRSGSGGLLGQLGLHLALDALRGDRQLLVLGLDDEDVQAALVVEGAQRGVRDTQRERLAQGLRRDLDRLQRRQEATLGLDVRVAHAVADHGADTGEFATTRHLTILRTRSTTCADA